MNATTLRVARHLLRGEDFGAHITAVTNVKPGTLYPMLARLKARGHLVTRLEPSVDYAAPRHYHSLTPEGVVWAIKSLEPYQIS